MNQSTFARRLLAEGLGTAALLATVVGSGIMGEKLAGGKVAIALLANTVATGAILVTLIMALGPISGQFNPAVTMVAAIRKELSWKQVPGYVGVQIAGAIVGVALANRMFDLPVFSLSQHVRAGESQWLSEFVATFGLLAVILACSKSRSKDVPVAVGLYITAAYWFTASKSFANPAVTLARTLSDTFAGIRPVDAPMFITAQLVGAVAAAVVIGFLLKEKDRT